MLTDSHPPGYVTFMYWTLPLTGYSDFGIRLHALVFGIAWLPLVFWLGRRWFSTNTGLLAAAVVASAYTAVYYSQEARAYTMLVAFNLVNLICFFEILFTKNKQRSYVIGFIVASVAMLYLHYTGFVFFCAEILWYGLLWLLRQRRGSIREAMIIFGVPLLLYSPWLGVMYANMTDSPRDWSVSKAPTLDEVCNTLQRLLGPDDDHKKFHLVTVCLALVCALVDHVKHGMSRRLSATYSLFFLMVVPVLAFYVESLVATPIFEKRYFLSVVVIEAVLVANMMSHVLGVVFKKSATIAVVFSIFIFSAWTINSNVTVRLYSLLDKDPIREAVELVKNDLGGNYKNNNYIAIMSHDWFEHYLRKNNIFYDGKWKKRHFYVPQQIGDVEEYLNNNKTIEYFYYLFLREPNAEAALVALKQQYRVLAKSEVSIEQGTIDVFKFSAKELPDAEQLKGVGTNPSNEVAKLVARNAAGKDPATYRVLYTHDWVLPYLRRNGVKVDHESGDGSYVINAQADNISRYLMNHPEIDTVYYLALQEPNAE
ncbi:MAG TPA: glycosyltransferase family 39 protein, partial [Pseudomonadales bacterium]|nr:glycosyltransferase family 39 protein [Pseudomonadales bacterium]